MTETGRLGRGNKILVHHTSSISDFGAAVTSVIFQMDGIVMGVGTLNPILPRAAKLVRAAVHAGTFFVNVAGNWTLRFRVNEAVVDSATMGFSVPTVPGGKTASALTADVLLQAGDTYHIQADGPSRNVFIARTTLEFEVL